MESGCPRGFSERHSRPLQVQNNRFYLTGLGSKSRKEAIYHAVKVQVSDDQGMLIQSRNKWTFKAKVICRDFWAHAHYTSATTIDVFRKHILEGGTSPPEVLPRVPAPKSSQQRLKADSWFLQHYQDLAESYPTEDPSQEFTPEDFHELVESPSHPLWTLSVALPASDGSKRNAPKRWLSPGSFVSLWELYEAQVPKSDQVSKSTFYNVWSLSWSKYMKFRNVGQGKRCRVCAALDEQRIKASSTEERVEIIQQKIAHVEQVKADRMVNTRGNSQSEHDSSSPSPDGSGKVLKICLDGMDQGKFRVPRNVVPLGEASNLVVSLCLRG